MNTKVEGYVKQMREEETEKLKITDKNCLDREQYGKNIKRNRDSHET